MITNFKIFEWSEELTTLNHIIAKNDVGLMKKYIYNEYPYLVDKFNVSTELRIALRYKKYDIIKYLLTLHKPKTDTCIFFEAIDYYCDKSISYDIIKLFLDFKDFNKYQNSWIYDIDFFEQCDKFKEKKDCDLIDRIKEDYPEEYIQYHKWKQSKKFNL